MASVSRQQPILSLTGETPELHPANTIRKALTLEVFFLEWQQLLMAQKRPRGKRQKSPAQPERPRRERPPHDQSGTASEGFEAFCRRFIEPHLRKHVERQAEGDIKQSVRPTSSRESSTSGEASKQLIKLVLGLAQLIVHRYLAKRTATENTAEETQDSFSGISTQWSEAPLSGRDGSPLSARDDQLVASLDRVLDQLQATEDLLVRTMYSPASHENCQIHRSILVHANSLQAAIGRAAAEVRGLRGRLKSGDQGGNQCDRASEGARRQYGESASYYWPSGG